jgi:O-antigen ligase
MALVLRTVVHAFDAFAMETEKRTDGIKIKPEKYEGKERVLYFLLFCFFLSLYAPYIDWLYNAVMWLLFVYCFTLNRLDEKKTILLQRPDILLMVLFFLLNCISAFFSANQIFGLRTVGIRLNLLIFPIALGTISISQSLRTQIIRAFVNITAVAVLGCILFGLTRSIIRNDWSLIYNDNLSEVVNMQSVYLAQLVNLAFFAFVWLVTTGRMHVAKRNLILFPFLFFTANYLLASRTAIFILYGGLMMTTIYWSVKRKKILWAIGVMAGVAILLCGMILLFPKTLNRFRELEYRKYDYHNMAVESHFNAPVTAGQWNGATVRIAIWHSAWLVIRQHMIAGTGVGDKMDKLKQAYESKGFRFGIEKNRNTHNTYLDVWMSMGLIGLVLFLSAYFIIPLQRCIRHKDFLGAVWILCFLISLMFENYSDRTLGNTILAFFISFIAASRSPTYAKRPGYHPGTSV